MKLLTHTRNNCRRWEFSCGRWFRRKGLKPLFCHAGETLICSSMYGYCWFKKREREKRMTMPHSGFKDVFSVNVYFIEKWASDVLYTDLRKLNTSIDHWKCAFVHNDDDTALICSRGNEGFKIFVCHITISVWTRKSFITSLYFIFWVTTVFSSYYHIVH